MRTPDLGPPLTLGQRIAVLRARVAKLDRWDGRSVDARNHLSNADSALQTAERELAAVEFALDYENAPNRGYTHVHTK